MSHLINVNVFSSGQVQVAVTLVSDSARFRVAQSGWLNS